MSSIRKTPDAKTDLVDIWYYIADDSPENADRFLKRLEAKSLTLADMPNMGQRCPDIGPEVRSFVFQHYTIYYRPLDNTVQIVRVLHQARDLSRQNFPET